MAKSPTSTRSKWVLTSLAAVGLLALGLLGGMQIGQSMTPSGPAAVGPVVIHQGGQGQFDRVPDGVKERMKDNMKDRIHDRLQERRDQGPAPESPDQNNG